MKSHRHLERAIELLQPRLEFGAYKESQEDIKLVSTQASISRGQQEGIIVGYQVTLQPIKVGKFPKPDPENPQDRSKYVKYMDERLNRQAKHQKDRDRVYAGKFDEVIDEILQNNDIFTVEEPILSYNFDYHFDGYIVALITDIKEPDGSELAKTIEEARLRKNYQRSDRISRLLNKPWSNPVIARRLQCNLRMLKLLHKPMLLVCEKFGNWSRICMCHINGMDLNILPGSEDHYENIHIQKNQHLARDWELLDPLWNDKHPMLHTHSPWEYIFHKSKKANHLVTKRNFYR